MKIDEAVRAMLRIVAELRRTHPQKRFTLDGRLVGDLGEILAEQIYALRLHDTLTAHHDATADDGRMVQIKATMQSSLTFPADHIPHYYIGLKIDENGNAQELYNGPGALVWEQIKHRRTPKNNLHSVSIPILSRVNGLVSKGDRIPERKSRTRGSCLS